MSQAERIASLVRRYPGVVPLYLFENPWQLTISRITTQSSMDLLHHHQVGSGVPPKVDNPIYAYFVLTQGQIGSSVALFGVEIPSEDPLSGDTDPIFYWGVPQPGTHGSPQHQAFSEQRSLSAARRDAVITFLYDWLGLEGVDTLYPERTNFGVPIVMTDNQLEEANRVGLPILEELQAHWKEGRKRLSDFRTETKVPGIWQWKSMMGRYMQLMMRILTAEDPRSLWTHPGMKKHLELDATGRPTGLIQRFLFSEQGAVVQMVVHDDHATFKAWYTTADTAKPYPTLIQALSAAGLITDDAGWDAWLDLHQMDGRPREGIPDLDVYFALAVTPPPLSPLPDFLRWSEALELRN